MFHASVRCVPTMKSLSHTHTNPWDTIAERNFYYSSEDEYVFGEVTRIYRMSIANVAGPDFVRWPKKFFFFFRFLLFSVTVSKDVTPC